MNNLSPGKEQGHPYGEKEAKPKSQKKYTSEFQNQRENITYWTRKENFLGKEMQRFKP